MVVPRDKDTKRLLIMGQCASFKKSGCTTLRTFTMTFKPAGLTRVKFMFIVASDHVLAVVVDDV
jgi:hypothetical protein